MLSIVFKFFKGCCAITACSYRLTLPITRGIGLTLNLIIPYNFYSLSWICGKPLPYCHSSRCLLIPPYLYPNFLFPFFHALCPYNSPLYRYFFLFLEGSVKFPPYNRASVQHYFFLSCHYKFSRSFSLINSLHYIKYKHTCI